jgi:hypothetical protein
MQVEWAAPRSVPPLFSRILYVGNLRPVREHCKHMWTVLLCDAVQSSILCCMVQMLLVCEAGCEESTMLHMCRLAETAGY